MKKTKFLTIAIFIDYSSNDCSTALLRTIIQVHPSLHSIIIGQIQHVNV